MQKQSNSPAPTINEPHTSKPSYLKVEAQHEGRTMQFIVRNGLPRTLRNKRVSMLEEQELLINVVKAFCYDGTKEVAHG